MQHIGPMCGPSARPIDRPILLPGSLNVDKGGGLKVQLDTRVGQYVSNVRFFYVFIIWQAHLHPKVPILAKIASGN